MPLHREWETRNPRRDIAIGAAIILDIVAFWAVTAFVLAHFIDKYW